MNSLKLMLGLAICGHGLAAQAQTTLAQPWLQSAADVLRESAGADAAFFPASMARTDFSGDDLSTVARYPSDSVAVVQLKGSQIRVALEKSIALYPAANDGFLALSNIEATFNRTGAPENRLVSVSLGGAKLEDGRQYNVAMPGTLARGALGYFKVWDRRAIVRSLDSLNLEQIFKGKKVVDSPSRWKVSG